MGPHLHSVDEDEARALATKWKSVNMRVSANSGTATHDCSAAIEHVVRLVLERTPQPWTVVHMSNCACCPQKTTTYSD
jgi:hypothetical protein